jgi:hypothetical protein
LGVERWALKTLNLFTIDDMRDDLLSLRRKFHGTLRKLFHLRSVCLQPLRDRPLDPQPWRKETPNHSSELAEAI